MEFLFKPISNKKQLGGSRSLSSIKYLIIHDTGNESKGADAMAHYRYLQNATRPGSAHIYVDDKRIIQTIGDSRIAWSIGDTWAIKNRTVNDAKNANTLNIELCINSDIDEAKAYKNLVELTKNYMQRLNIPASRVIRHFDASGKPCPGSWKANNWAKWKQFKRDIQKPIEWKIDLSKSSKFGDRQDPIKQPPKKEETKVERDENLLLKWAEEEWQKAKELKITDGTRPNAFATRAEVASMIVRALEVENGKCDCLDNGSTGYRTGL